MSIFLRAHKNEQGFSIMELVVAAALIAVGVTSVLVMFNSSLKTTAGSKVRALANSLMNEKMEMTRTFSYSDITATYLNTHLGNTVVKGGVTFNVTYTVTNIDNPSDGSGINDVNPVDYKTLRITVAWTNPSPASSISSETILNNNPLETVTYNDDTNAPVWPNGGNVLTGSAQQSNPGLGDYLLWAPNWATDNKGVVGYLVYCKAPGQAEFLLAATTAPSVGWYLDSNYTALQNYSYYVKAYDAKGNISTATNAVTINAPQDSVAPSMPTNLSAYANSSTSVVLSWTPSTDNSLVINHYNIYRTHSGFAFGSTPYTTSADSPFNDYGLTTGTTYQYYIEAVDNAGNVSARTSAISVTP